MIERRHHTQEELNHLAIWLQQKILENLCKIKKWQAGDIAFHGGTSLRLMYDSPRYSEDLDFLIHPEVRLKPLMQRLHQELTIQMKDTFGPNSNLHLKMKEYDDKPFIVYRFNLERPNRYTNVEVKVEFSMTPVVIAYGSNRVKTNTTLKYIDSIELKVDPYSFPVGNIQQLFWDKMYAIAHRPYVKQRDLFDINWLYQFPNCPKPNYQEMVEKLELMNNIYQYPTSLPEFLQKIKDRVTLFEKDEFKSGFFEEMKRWLPVAYLDENLVTNQLEAAISVLKQWSEIELEEIPVVAMVVNHE